MSKDLHQYFDIKYARKLTVFFFNGDNTIWKARGINSEDGHNFHHSCWDDFDDLRMLLNSYPCETTVDIINTLHNHSFTWVFSHSQVY